MNTNNTFIEEIKQRQKEILTLVKEFLNENKIQLGKTSFDILSTLTDYSNDFQVIFHIKDSDRKLRISTYGGLSIKIIDDNTLIKENNDVI